MIRNALFIKNILHKSIIKERKYKVGIIEYLILYLETILATHFVFSKNYMLCIL